MARKDGRVLVTGAAGHLGANLVRELLRDGDQVRVLLREGSNNSAVDGLDVECSVGDLRDPSAVRRAVRGCARVYHCAAMVSTVGGKAVEREIYACNVVGTRNVLHAAISADVSRVVVSGSFSAVGYDPDNPSAPSDETMPFYPFNRPLPYSTSKALVEQQCWQASALGLPVVVAVSTAIIGPHDFKPSRIGRTLLDFANGRMRVYVPGGFEFVAARDIVAGHRLAMQRGRDGERYIFSSGYMELQEILDIFARVTGRRPRVAAISPAAMTVAAEIYSYVLNRWFPGVQQRFTPGAIRILRLRRHADCLKAKNELGFEPTAIEDAVRDAYQCFLRRGLIDPPRSLHASAIRARRQSISKLTQAESHGAG